MKIQELKSIKKRSQRIGRSGKRGSYSGRGVKGQKSRSGRRLYPAERDLIMRIPKQRGFRNKPKGEAAKVFNLEELAARLKALSDGKGPVTLDLATLKAAGFLRKGYNGRVKILGEGDIALPIRVKGIRVSAGAAAKIKKAGGGIDR